MSDDDDQFKRTMAAWGAWFNDGGSAEGFPRKSVIHPTWMPPSSGGRLPAMAVAVRSDQRERMAHQAIGRLSDKLIVVMVGKWARRMTSAQMALELCVTSSAVDGRVARAHDQLRALLLL